jgi:hypothetical protein
MARHAITTPLAPVMPTISGARVDPDRSAFAAMIYPFAAALSRLHTSFVCSKLYPIARPHASHRSGVPFARTVAAL